MEIWDSCAISDNFVGWAKVPLADAFLNLQDKKYEITNREGRPTGHIRLVMRFENQEPGSLPTPAPQPVSAPQTAPQPVSFPQGGYPPAQYPPAQSGYPPAQGGYAYPPAQGGYPPAQGGYPPAQGGYPPAQGGYPPAQGGYPPAQGGYPQAQGGYPQAQGGYPPAQSGYPPAQYPPAQSGYPPAQSGYSPTQGGYPQAQSGYGNSPTQGGYPSQGGFSGQPTSQQPTYSPPAQPTYSPPAQTYSPPAQPVYSVQAQTQYDDQPAYTVQPQAQYDEDYAAVPVRQPPKFHHHHGGHPINIRAVEGSQDRTGAIQIVVRIHHSGSIQPGKYTLNREHAFFSYFGSELSSQKFEILEDDSSNFAWAICNSVDDIPIEKVVPIGQDADGQPLYSARARFDGTFHLGKAGGDLPSASIPYSGKEEYATPFEVLVYKN